MPQDPNMSQSAEEQAPGEPPSNTSGPLTDMIVQTDQALSSIAQVLEKASPEAAQALAQLSEQFRKIIQSVMSQGQSQGPRPASPMVSPETQGKASMQAY